MKRVFVLLCAATFRWSIVELWNLNSCSICNIPHQQRQRPIAKRFFVAAVFRCEYVLIHSVTDFSLDIASYAIRWYSLVSHAKQYNVNVVFFATGPCGHVNDMSALDSFFPSLPVYFLSFFFFIGFVIFWLARLVHAKLISLKFTNANVRSEKTSQKIESH